MTPMVDLGFLLIAFFIFTTSLMEPTAMKLNMPDPSGFGTEVPESVSMTLLLRDKGNIYYYEKKPANTTILRKASLYQRSSIRTILLDKKKKTECQKPPFNEMVVIIKPSAKTSYKEVVDILDEMIINSIKKYVIIEPDPMEIALIGLTEKR